MSTAWTLNIGDEEGCEPRLTIRQAAATLEARIGRGPDGLMNDATDAQIGAHLEAIAASHGYRSRVNAETREAFFWPPAYREDARPIGYRRGGDGRVKVTA